MSRCTYGKGSSLYSCMFPGMFIAIVVSREKLMRSVCSRRIETTLLPLSLANELPSETLIICKDKIMIKMNYDRSYLKVTYIELPHCENTLLKTTKRHQLSAHMRNCNFYSRTRKLKRSTIAKRESKVRSKRVEGSKPLS